MKLAFLYAGQGAQKCQMGKDLYESESVFRSRFDDLDTDGTIKNLCFEAPIEELSKTQNTQPCMVAFAVAMTDTLASYGIVPDMTAGLSLGEYSALYTAGVLEGQQAVDLVAFRGLAMSRACADVACSMAAVLGLGRTELEDACVRARTAGVVSIANYNCPNQLILSGETVAVELASTYAKELGAKRVMPLNVSGAFHTELMRGAGDELKQRFANETFGDIKIPVIFNTTAKPLAQGESIPQILEQQVQSSVYFEDGIRYMLDAGVDTFIEIGPGKILSGFIKKITKEVTIYQVEDVTSLQQTLEALKGASPC